MISVYDIYRNNLSNEDISLLQEIGIYNKPEIVMKTSLLFLKKDNIKEKEIFDIRGMEFHLSNSSDILKTLKFFLTKNKELTEFVCEMFGNKKCTPYGLRISESLIRVAATRIFAEPEQSIMELPVNSVDSYNLINGKKTVGKFGMGFFSMLYWISEAKNGYFPRILTVSSTFKDLKSNNLISYSVTLKWTSKGLIVEKSNDESSQVPSYNGTITTGTVITLDCTKYPLDDEVLRKMTYQLSKLFAIEGATIFVNNNQINSGYKDRVYVTFDKNFVRVIDNASGISLDTLNNSLLVPSVSTKERINEIDIFKSPEIVENSFGEDILNIIVNGVCINNITNKIEDNSNNIFINTNGDFTPTKTINHPIANKSKTYSYNIYMPYNCKLPVSRDDIIYEELEIKSFKKSLMILLENIRIKTGNLTGLFKLLNSYTKINKSENLFKTILDIRNIITSSSYILIPDIYFWKNVQSTNNKFIIYDDINIHDTELKLEPILKSNTNKNIFKLRNVVIVPHNNLQNNMLMDNANLSSYLFISDRVKDFSQLSLSNPDTLLIPYDENFDVEIFTNLTTPLNKLIKDDIDMSNAIKLLKMTYLRKYSKVKRQFVYNDKYPEKIAEVFYTQVYDKEAFIRFIVALNSKIGSTIFKFAYGSDIYFYQIKFPYKLPNHSKDVGYGVKDKKTTSIGNELNKFLLNLGKDMILFYVDLIAEVSGGYDVMIPSFDGFLFGVYNSNFFTEKFCEEYLNGLKLCISRQEYFIYMHIFIKVANEIQNKTNGSILGLASYIVDEIRRKISNFELLIMLKNLYSSHNYGKYFELRVLNPIYLSAHQFYLYSNDKIKISSIELNTQYKFSCKSLLHYVYNNEIINGEIWETLSENYKTFDPKLTKLQVVEIAVNEGTTKPFVQSVLTEIVQNSVDAIRSAGSVEIKNEIDINIYDNIIEIKDYIGFKDVVTLLIPFLSSKNPNDPNVTGEMGTGFFNVYRQPWTKFIVIRTIYNGISHLIKAKPLVNDKLVYDIEYSLEISETNLENSTTITIFLYDDKIQLSQLITDAHIFTNTYLSFISSAIVKLNGKIVKRDYSICYQSELLDIITIKDNSTMSHVMTNDIPFISLQDFINSIDNKNLTIIANKLCNTSIIVNLKKDIYKPTQSRSKVNIDKTKKPMLEKLLFEGLIYGIMSLYSNDLYIYPDDVIPHTSSESDPIQLKLSVYGDNNYFTTYNSKFTLNGFTYDSILDLINDFIDRLYGDIYTDKYTKITYKNIKTSNPSTLIDRSTLLGRVVYKWFSNKNTDNNLDGQLRPKLPNRNFTTLQKFVDIYWKMFHQLVDEKIVKIIKPRFDPPKIISADMLTTILGFYTKETHQIELNDYYYDMKILDDELLKIKGKDINKISSMFNINDIFSKYFSPCKPASTLLHEIGHAFLSSSHNDSFHGIQNVTINNSEKLEFDDMCVRIYILCVERGLMNNFLAKI